MTLVTSPVLRRRRRCRACLASSAALQTMRGGEGLSLLAEQLHEESPSDLYEAMASGPASQLGARELLDSMHKTRQEVWCHMLSRTYNNRHPHQSHQCCMAGVSKRGPCSVRQMLSIAVDPAGAGAVRLPPRPQRPLPGVQAARVPRPGAFPSRSPREETPLLLLGFAFVSAIFLTIARCWHARTRRRPPLTRAGWRRCHWARGSGCKWSCPSRRRRCGRSTSLLPKGAWRHGCRPCLPSSTAGGTSTLQEAVAGARARPRPIDHGGAREIPGR